MVADDLFKSKSHMSIQAIQGVQMCKRVKGVAQKLSK